MSTDDLTRLSACAVVDLLARGEISPADLLDAAEARIAETDSVLNALPTLCFDRAQAHAEREISLLHEYRTRLIADVVTGKIDVREDVHRES